MSSPIIFLSGPTDGEDYPALFAEMESEFQARGLTVIGPAETDARERIIQITQCDVVAMMDGWQTSEDAGWVKAVAASLSLPVVLARPWLADLDRQARSEGV